MKGWSPIRWLLVLLLVVVVGMSGWAGYVYVGSPLMAKQPSADAVAKVEDIFKTRVVATSEAELPLPEEGEPAWLLTIPRLNLKAAVVVGTSSSALFSGVGWYPTTELPGEPGTMGVAGQRFTDGKQFAHFEDLRVGDQIKIESRIKTYTYTVKVTGLTVDKDASWILEPMPGKKFGPREAVLTLTTQQDLIQTDERAVIFAVLTKEEKK